jgi:Mg-chelatase subunit ChlD
MAASSPNLYQFARGIGALGWVVLALFSVSLASDRDLTMTAGAFYEAWPASDSVFSCAVRLQAPKIASERRQAVHVQFVVDISDQMRGEPLEAAKGAIRRTAESLKDGDFFGVVAFARNARAVLPLQPMNPAARQSIASLTKSLREERGWDLSQGVITAREQFDRFKGQNTSGRYLFLLTNRQPDSDSRQSIVDEAVRLAAAGGFRVSTFGVEEHFDELLLERLAHRTAGRYYFTEEPRDILGFVSREARRISDASARQVQLHVTLPEACRIAQVRGAMHEQERLKIGELVAGSPHTVLFDLVGRPAQEQELELRVEYVEPGRSSVRKQREYLPLYLTTTKPEMDQTFAPIILVHDMIETLADRDQMIREHRRDCAVGFRNEIDRLEQKNVTLNSDYIREKSEYLESIQQLLENTAQQDSLVIKEIRFRRLLLLYAE